MRHAILLCLCWPVLAEAPEPERPPASALAALDGGLLDPAWFGPGVAWAPSPGLDFGWVQPEVRLDRPLVYLAPWELPRLARSKDPLDHALAGEISETLQNDLRDSLSRVGGVQWARAPGDTPYHAVGRVVEATHIREGALATLGPMAGWPTHTWDFKVVDLRTGQTLLATHHRAAGAGHFAWMSFVGHRLGDQAGLAREDRQAWVPPPAAKPLPAGGEVWSDADFRLGDQALDLLPWTADTDQFGVLSRAWTSGWGQALASRVGPALARTLKAKGFHLGAAEAAAYRLQGTVFTGKGYPVTQYRTALVDAATGEVVARIRVPAPIALDPPAKVADRVAEALVELGAVPEASPGPPSPPALLDLWEGPGPLEPGPGALDAVWVSPGFSLAGHGLQVADWLPPFHTPKATPTDQTFAAITTRLAPGWLLGSLTPFQKDGLQVSRTRGDLRLEGQVVDIREANLMHFGKAMAAGLTLGLAAKSHLVFQIRVVDQDTGATRLLVRQRVVSFKVASSGTDYKAMKWMAQAFVPWLVKAGSKPQ